MPSQSLEYPSWTRSMTSVSKLYNPAPYDKQKPRQFLVTFGRRIASRSVDFSQSRLRSQIEPTAEGPSWQERPACEEDQSKRLYFSIERRLPRLSTTTAQYSYPALSSWVPLLERQRTNPTCSTRMLIFLPFSTLPTLSLTLHSSPLTSSQFTSQSLNVTSVRLHRSQAT